MQHAVQEDDEDVADVSTERRKTKVKNSFALIIRWCRKHVVAESIFRRRMGGRNEPRDVTDDDGRRAAHVDPLKIHTAGDTDFDHCDRRGPQRQGVLLRSGPRHPNEEKHLRPPNMQVDKGFEPETLPRLSELRKAAVCLVQASQGRLLEATWRPPQKVRRCGRRSSNVTRVPGSAREFVSRISAYWSLITRSITTPSSARTSSAVLHLLAHVLTMFKVYKKPECTHRRFRIMVYKQFKCEI